MTRGYIWIDIAHLEDNVHEMKDVLCVIFIIVSYNS